ARHRRRQPDQRRSHLRTGRQTIRRRRRGRFSLRIHLACRTLIVHIQRGGSFVPDRPDLSPKSRADAFAARIGMELPILLAPMRGPCPPSPAAAAANAGGMGGGGALLMQPDEIKQWVAEFRLHSAGPLQINLWIPEPLPPVRDASSEQRQR